MTAEIVTRELVKSFETPAGTLAILDQISIEIHAGEAVAVTGPSGSGKSTFLHIIGTLDQPTSGSVRLLDTDPFALAAEELAAFRNRRIGFVFQEHHLLPQLSALENVLLPTIAHGKSSPQSVDRARVLLDQVGLGQRLDHRPAHLSGGERQRVAVARALINEPSILLADEPTGSLDQSNAREIGELLLDIQKSGNLALVCVTHNEEFAARFGRRVRLENGRFVEDGVRP